ncbi:MAG: pyridoxal-phosphate dependent enzyme [Pseudomonadota bacterium]
MTQFILDPALPQSMLKACPAYAESPLVKADLDGQPYWIKDETQRMGLNAFKAVGGVYAVAMLILRQIGSDDPLALTTGAGRAQAAQMEFICASAGNHGMSVAKGAQIFGAKARIHLSATVPDGFADRLRAVGATVVRSGKDYEESVALAVTDAQDRGSVHLADGAWPGYTEEPRLVMEGYTIIAEEMRAKFEANQDWPSHVFLQAGVGGLAGSVAHMIRMRWAVQPKIIVAEPSFAPCLKESVAAGQLTRVTGPVSGMGRLDCKDASLIAFDILKDAADAFETITEKEGAAAVDLAAQMGVASTASGCAGLAVAHRYGPMDNPLVILSEAPT